MRVEGHVKAREDGIRCEPSRARRGSSWVYYIPCDMCGEEVKYYQYNRSAEHLCPACRKKVREKIKALLKESDVRTAAEKRFDEAVSRLSTHMNITGYEKAIEIAETKCELYGSVPEAMVAILLIREGFKIIPQQKIGKYHVDFCIPDCKAIVEVDGSIYHTNKQKDLEREAAINYKIGLDWNVIHIDAAWTDRPDLLIRLLIKGLRGQKTVV